MEKAILNRLEWNLTVPTPYVFLVRFAKAASSSDHKNDEEMENTVFFFAELALLQYGLVQSKPSMVAAAAVYTARLTLKKTPLWTDTLKHHTGFTEAQLMDAAKILVASHSTAPDSKLKVVYKKLLILVILSITLVSVYFDLNIGCLIIGILKSEEHDHDSKDPQTRIENLGPTYQNLTIGTYLKKEKTCHNPKIKRPDYRAWPV
ncbi:cyclin-B1-1-like [Triticum dicoccoides]|uniref:cyclin-B1-1-like n=1 Tax=Triticum dicoccoides TaxID=85692 RepID=UPI00188F1EF5|nr:cyclin-B1-1-like [Triticum dicoccoides]